MIYRKEPESTSFLFHFLSSLFHLLLFLPFPFLPLYLFLLAINGLSGDMPGVSRIPLWALIVIILLAVLILLAIAAVIIYFIRRRRNAPVRFFPLFLITFLLLLFSILVFPSPVLISLAATLFPLLYFLFCWFLSRMALLLLGQLHLDGLCGSQRAPPRQEADLPRE